MNGRNNGWLETRWNERNDERLERMYFHKLKKAKEAVYGDSGNDSCAGRSDADNGAVQGGRAGE